MKYRALVATGKGGSKMGGRGSAGGKGAGGGFAALAQSTKGRWDYRENDQKIEQLKNALSRARSVSKINSVARAARALDKIITAEINRIEQGYVKDGDLTALMAQRRKVRMLMRKAII